MFKKLVAMIGKKLDLGILKKVSTQIYAWQRGFCYRDFSKSAQY